LYRGPRLNGVGVRRWPMLLEEAARWHDDDWLSGQLAKQGLIGDHEMNIARTGQRILESIKIQISAAMLAEREFNKFYMRALCMRAIQSGITKLEFYRGRCVAKHTHELDEKVGTFIDPYILLSALRNKNFVSLEQYFFGIREDVNGSFTARLPLAKEP
jgi:hypothetical protein